MIRPALPADLAAVLALGKAAFAQKEDRLTARWLLDALTRPGCSLLVWSDLGTIAGFVLTYPTRGYTEAKMLAVASDYRRMGIGRRLMATCPAPARTWIRPDNIASQSLCKSLGWVCREPDEDGWQRWELVARPENTTQGD